MGFGRVREEIQLLLRDPDQSLLQITSIVLDVPVVSHEKQEPVQNHRREKFNN